MDGITPGPVHGHGANDIASTSAAAMRADYDTRRQFNTQPAQSLESDQSIDYHDDIPVSDNCFAFSPSQLHKLLTARSIAALRAFGGLHGLVVGLRTDAAAGLSVDETTLDGAVTFDEALAAARGGRPAMLADRPSSSSTTVPFSQALRLGEPRDQHYLDRKRVFGENSLPRRKQKSFFKLMWIAFNDKLIILLTISATISLAIGIYQSADSSIDASSLEWVDGVTIVTAIILIVLTSAAMDWQKNQKFKKLLERKEQRDVAVVRSGRTQRISLYDVLVGDVMHVEAGDVVAVDGVLIEASSLQVDESAVSGESDLVHKTGAGTQDLLRSTHPDPFILSGTTVSRGVGRYLVTSVGENSTYGRMLLSLRNDVEETPLQAKLGRLGKQLIIVGAVAGSIFFIVLFIRFLINLHTISGPSEKAEAFLHTVIISVTLVVITVPEGLALNVTIALAFAAKRMLKDNNLVRLLRSCETMGNATCVCSDKTGTLTQNKMTVVAGRIGLEGYFDDTIPVDDDDFMSRASGANPVTSSELVATLSPEIRELTKESMALNSTAFESDNSGVSEFVGSSTETALLEFSRQHLGMGLLSEVRANSRVVAMLPFDPSRKWMAVLIKLPDGKYRLLIKGAAEVVFEYCAFIVRDPTYKETLARLSEDHRNSFHNAIRSFATKMLRPVAIAYKDFDESDVSENLDDDLEYVNLEWLASGMVLLGVFGICDPLRPEVVESVRNCQGAGVFVRMVTGDNFLTAKAIATECGIYTAGGIAMDGPTFRDLTPSQLDAVIPRLQVLARSSPEDKLLLVSHLKQMKETVAVTGDGTNDALALKAADVGYAMGMQGTEVAKEAASIILLDDNFASIVKAIGWGRTVSDAVKKFCQFQFTINITAAIITIVSEFVGDSIFSVVQLLWINLMMDIFASLAFATDSPSPEMLKRRPEPRNAMTINIPMWKMILGQSIYQLIVIFVVHYAGWDIFNPDTPKEVESLQTLVFNIYVWMQFFNQHNCRRVDNKIDIWHGGILRNPWFVLVQVLTVVGQFVIIFKGGEAFDTHPLTGAQWGWSMLFGFLTIPLGALIRQFPDRLVLHFFLVVYGWYLDLTQPFRSCVSRLRGQRQREQDTEQQQEMGVVSDEPQTSPEPDEEEAVRNSSDRDTPVNFETDDMGDTERPRRHLDVQGLVDAAKLGREISGVTFELHPKTFKEDPILFTPRSKTVPPSQDPTIRTIINRHLDRRLRRPNMVTSPNPGRQPIAVPQRAARPQVQRRRSRFSWEWLLRSQRR